MATSDPKDNIYERHNEDQLVYYSEKANTKTYDQHDDELFINMSIRDIILKLSHTMVEIINDITVGRIQDTRSAVHVLFGGDRMIYVGLLFVFFAFSMYLIDVTS